MKKQEATLHFQDSRERSEGGRAMFLFVIELERCRSELGSLPLILLFSYFYSSKETNEQRRQKSLVNKSARFPGILV